LFGKSFSARWLTTSPNANARRREQKTPAPLAGGTGQKIRTMEDLSQSNCVVNVFRPAESSVEAFRYLVRQKDSKRLQDWLAKRSPEEKAFFENNRDGK